MEEKVNKSEVRKTLLSTLEGFIYFIGFIIVLQVIGIVYKTTRYIDLTVISLGCLLIYSIKYKLEKKIKQEEKDGDIKLD